MKRGFLLACAAALCGCTTSFDEGLLVDSSGPRDQQAAESADSDQGGDTVDSRDAYTGEGKAPLGSICEDDGHCASGICASGTCCQTSCSQLCYRCNLEGQCVPVPAGSDPLSQCAKDAASTCDQDGTCDGKGACRLYSTSTTCQSTCSGDSVQRKKCDGKGACAGSTTTTDCSPYTCDSSANTCYTSCSGDEECAESFACKGQFCK